MNYHLSAEDLAYRQRLPLDIKVRMTELRIRDFMNVYDAYVSFSGGKDSTVLLHIARNLYPSIKAVYADTWMEYPQVRQFVKGFDNVDIVKPTMSMKDIISECGWCFPSKDVAEMIEAVRNDKEWAIRKLNGLDKDGNLSEFRQQYKKWQILVDAPFKISARCCDEMKEIPIKRYEKETGRQPIMALMADESSRRKYAYLKTGCNAFESARPKSTPMGFWTEQDVLSYINKNNIEIPSVYGDIVEAGQCEGQCTLFEDTYCELTTTGEKRTGCMFCPVGCHLDNFSKYKRLKKFNPKLYDYCMQDLGLADVVDWIRKNVVKR